MTTMKKSLLLLALSLLICAPAYAGAVADSGRVLQVGEKKTELIGGLGADGTQLIPMFLNYQGYLFVKDSSLARGSNNELYVTELNPLNYQNGVQTIVNVALTAGQANTAAPGSGTGLTPYDASIYGMKWVRVTGSSFSNAAIPWSVRWWGSSDGVTYLPLTKGVLAYTSGHRFGPSIAVDTLKIQGHGSFATGWFPLASQLAAGADGQMVTLKKIVAVASIDSAAGTGTVTVEVAGRMY